MKARHDKSNLLLSLVSDEDAVRNTNKDEISNSKAEKILRVLIDCQLNFGEDVSQICHKASQKLSVLDRISPFMKPNQKSA